jgi:mRNA-degrading endonuclease RelE of RelBE toxin-antitoxin system
MYSIKIRKRAQKQLRELPLFLADRIAVAIDNLAENPRPAGTEKTAGIQSCLSYP